MVRVHQYTVTCASSFVQDACVTALEECDEDVEAMRRDFEEAGITVNCCAAMGEDFDSLRHIYRGSVNVVVSSAGRRPARYMERVAGIPRVEGIPIGKAMSRKLMDAVRQAYQDHRNVILYGENEEHDRWTVPEGQILIIGEEVFAQTLASCGRTLQASEPDCMVKAMVVRSMAPA